MTLLLAALIASAPAGAATPLAGVQWAPLSRADLTWVAEDRNTGTAVGEFDGVVHPNLSAFGGAWLGDHVGLVGSLGVARLTSTTWVDDVYTSRHRGVVRPELDLRYGLGPREEMRPAPWLLFGAYGDIPSAREVSNGFTEDEQQAADEAAYIDRARLGGFGFRAGAGVDYRFGHGIAIGATWSLRWHRGVLLTPEVDVISSWLAADAGLLLTFEWEQTGRPGQSKSPRDRDQAGNRPVQRGVAPF